MYIPEHKPVLKLNDKVVDNLSPDGKVYFIEEGHSYHHTTDPIKFSSPTALLALYKGHFDAEKISTNYVKKHKLDITPEELRAQWSEKARVASERGSKLHAYCESLYDGWDFGSLPEEPQARHAENALAKIKEQGWELAKTELLVYSVNVALAGQVDLLLKRKGPNGKALFGIFDYKFLKEPIQKKSYYNPYTRKYKMMTGPFKYLMDCNYYHYSIQMELYRMLMGGLKDRVTHKTLVVMTEDDYELEEGFPMKIWIDAEGELQARYKMFNGKTYDSSKEAL